MAIANFTVGLPVANVLKFTRDGERKDYRANFDQQSFAEAVHASTSERSYMQILEKADTFRHQFYSNFPACKLETIKIQPNSQTVVKTQTPTVEVDYQNKKYRSACKFYSLDGKLFVYFSEGPEYLDEDFLEQGEVIALDGRKPAIPAKAGDILRYKIGDDDFAFTVIEEIAWSPELSAEGYKANVDVNLLTPVDGLVEVTYDEKPYNLFAPVIDNSSLEPGCYKFKLSFGIKNTNWLLSFTSEPVDIQEVHDRSLAIHYRHAGTYSKKELWKYEYLEDWTNVMRLPSEFFKFEPAGEVDQYMSDAARPDVLRAMPYREMEFTAFHIPSWLVDKLNVIFAHDTKKINGYHWANNDFGTVDAIERTDLTVFNIKLRQIEDRTIFSEEFSAEVTASFDPPTHTNINFAGDVVSSTFRSNTAAIFRFLELPDWIHPDKETFVDGDVINFTIDENEELFERLESLLAVNDDFDGLNAAVSFHQVYDDTEPPPPEFIEVSDDTINLPWQGTYQMISVNASGPYSVSVQSGFAFSFEKQSGGIYLIIYTNNQNTGVANRTGTLRLSLDSNPSVFVDVDVTQAFRPKEMFNTIPGLDQTIGQDGELFIVHVATNFPTTKWQAKASTADSSWLHFDKTIKTGSQDFEVLVDGRPPYIPAGSYLRIDFVNINDATDYVTYTIQRN